MTVRKLFGGFVEILLTLFRFTKTEPIESTYFAKFHETLQRLLFIVNLISEYDSNLSLLALERL